MANKEITEIKLISGKLEVGTFPGVQGGYVISVKNNKFIADFKTKDGVRGFNIPKSVTITEDDGVFKATY